MSRSTLQSRRVKYSAPFYAGLAAVLTGLTMIVVTMSTGHWPEIVAQFKGGGTTLAALVTAISIIVMSGGLLAISLSMRK